MEITTSSQSMTVPSESVCMSCPAPTGASAAMHATSRSCASCATLTAAIDGATLPALTRDLGSNPVDRNPASDAAKQAVFDALRANEARRAGAS